MGLFRMLKFASFAWGVYRTYSRYRVALRSNAHGAKRALKRARRAL